MLRLILTAVCSISLLCGTGCDDKKKPEPVKPVEKDEGPKKM